MRTQSIQGFKHVFFDIFDTLIYPRIPVHDQYTEVAKQFGIEVNITLSDFKKAFKKTTLEHPNYGKSNGINPEKWWTLVIRRTFENTGLPQTVNETQFSNLTSTLISRFSTSVAYEVFEDVEETLKILKQNKFTFSSITNSDSRIISVINSSNKINQFLTNDLILTSWEVGVAKPDPKIWLHAMSNHNSRLISSGLEPLNPNMFLHVGDDLKEDYEGALASGIQSVLLCRPKDGQVASDHQLDRIQWISSLRELTKMC